MVWQPPATINYTPGVRDYSSQIFDAIGTSTAPLVAGINAARDRRVSQQNADTARMVAERPEYADANGRRYNKRTGEWVDGNDASTHIGGTGLDNQMWEIIFNGDPASPAYDAAYTVLFETPKMTLKDTGNGLVPVYELPKVPASVRPPVRKGSSAAPPPVTPGDPAAIIGGGGSGPPGSSAPNGGGTVVPPPAGISTGPVIPGTKPPPSAATQRAATLDVISAPELSIVDKTFDSLASGRNIAGGIVGDMLPGALGNNVKSLIQDENGQRGSGALAAIVQPFIYLASGAAAPFEEVNKITAMVTPLLGDGPQTLADKRARIHRLVNAIAVGSGRITLEQAQQIVMAPSDAGDQAAAPDPSQFDQNGVHLSPGQVKAPPASQSSAGETPVGGTDTFEYIPYTKIKPGPDSDGSTWKPTSELGGASTGGAAAAPVRTATPTADKRTVVATPGQSPQAPQAPAQPTPGAQATPNYLEQYAGRTAIDRNNRLARWAQQMIESGVWTGDQAVAWLKAHQYQTVAQERATMGGR